MIKNKFKLIKFDINKKSTWPPLQTLVVGWHSSQLTYVVCFLQNAFPKPYWCLNKSCFYTQEMASILELPGQITHWMLLPKRPKQK